MSRANAEHILSNTLLHWKVITAKEQETFPSFIYDNTDVFLRQSWEYVNLVNTLTASALFSSPLMAVAPGDVEYDNLQSFNFNLWKHQVNPQNVSAQHLAQRSSI